MGRLAHVVKRPMPTYHIKAREHHTDGRILKKAKVFPMDWLQGGPFRILIPPTGYLTTYGKFFMDKYMKKENTQKIFINEFPSFQIPYFSKRLIIDKETINP